MSKKISTVTPYRFAWWEVAAVSNKCIIRHQCFCPECVYYMC